MSIELRPSFKVVEPNKLTGLRIGHVLAQQVALVDNIAHTTFGTTDVLENGVIVSLDADGTIKNYADGTGMFLVYNEELIDGAYVGSDQQGEPFVDGKVYPRAIALYEGDVFTTDNFAKNGVADTVTDCYAKPVKGVLNLQVATTGAQFIATRTRMPNGKEGFKFTFLNRTLA